MSAQKNRSAPVVLGGEPRVDLLPPEVHANAKLRSTQRLLGLLVVLALVAVAGGYGFAFIRWLDESVRLHAAEEQTSALQLEQLEYADATLIAGNVENAKASRVMVFSNEILWSELVDEVESKLPVGAKLESATMTARLPWEAEMVTQGPLRVPRVATIVFVVSSPSLLDTPTIIRGLSDIEGFGDATPDMVERKDLLFETTITLNLDRDALNDRFADEEDDK